MTGSSAIFLSPEPNGQGYELLLKISLNVEELFFELNT